MTTLAAKSSATCDILGVRRAGKLPSWRHPPRVVETRTSWRWKARPRSWDRLHLEETFPSDNEWGIPCLPPARFEPDVLVAWHDVGPGGKHAERAVARAAMAAARGVRDAGPLGSALEMDGAAPRSAAVHFFLGDHRFEGCWNEPERGLQRVQAVGAALSPDFSVYADMPRAAQVWQIYRSRWCGAYWASMGVQVVPTVSWSDAASLSFCLSGLPKRSALALSALGVGKVGRGRENAIRLSGLPAESASARREREAVAAFRAGLTEAVRRLEPSVLLVYGGLGALADGLELPRVREYPTWAEGRGWTGRTRTETS